MENLNEWKRGMNNGLPICFGYFAVSFALGIQCSAIGMTAFQAFFMSVANLTSAGEFAAIGVIAAGGSYLEMAFTQLVLNMRYFLMACALSQKIDPAVRFLHRFGIAYPLTDEIFALSACQRGRLNPFYTYGMMTVAVPGWGFGTLFGVIAGDVLPAGIISALGIAIYGMFLAIIIPETRKDRAVFFVVLSAMAMSCLFTYMPLLSELSSGMQVIIITLVIACAAAFLHPREEEEDYGA